MLTRQGPGDRRLPHPPYHLFRRLLLRDGRLCRSGAARHDLSRALGLHLAARPADRRTPMAPATPSASRSSQPDRDVRPLPGRADRPRRAARPARLRRPTAARAIPAAMPTTSCNHERTPGVGPLAGLRGADGEQARAGASPTRTSSSATSTTAASGARLAARAALFQARQPRLSGAGAQHRLHRPGRSRSCLQLYQRAAAEIPPRRARAMARSQPPGQPPRAHRDAISTRCPSGTRRFEQAASTQRRFPLHAITQRPMAMYHSWGSQNAWLRQILRRQLPLHASRARQPALGLVDDDWVWVDQPLTAASRAQIRLMDGVNPDTVWTWNAIGKRARRLGPGRRRPGGQHGFLLNHADRRAAAADAGGCR